MDAKIELKGMEFRAFHGCLEEEKRDGNLFRVDLSYVYDASAAAASDVIADAVDYSAVYEAVAREMAAPSELLENVAFRIKRAVESGFPEIRDVHVRVSKAHPPVRFSGPAPDGFVAGATQWSSVEL